MDHDHGGMSMKMDEPMDPAAQAKLLQDKKEGEFNHHLAGFFVLLAGIFILFEEPLKVRWPAVRYALPLCFLLSGLFVLIFRRATGVLRASWSAWVFPVLAFAGSVLLLFHVHSAGMHGVMG